jgi:hypothetical protein
MARWLRLRKQVPLLVISFLLSSLYRTVMRVWSVSSPLGEVRASTHDAKRGLLFVVARRFNNVGGNERSQRYAVELNGSFPFFHVQSLAPDLVPVAVSQTPCLSQTVRTPDVMAMQFGFGVAPSGNSGACNPAAGIGNAFTSNPPIPSTPIHIGEPAPAAPACEHHRCGGCEARCERGFCGVPTSTTFCDAGL